MKTSDNLSDSLVLEFIGSDIVDWRQPLSSIRPFDCVYISGDSWNISSFCRAVELFRKNYNVEKSCTSGICLSNHRKNISLLGALFNISLSPLNTIAILLKAGESDMSVSRYSFDWEIKHNILSFSKIMLKSDINVSKDSSIFSHKEQMVLVRLIDCDQSIQGDFLEHLTDLLTIQDAYLAEVDLLEIVPVDVSSIPISSFDSAWIQNESHSLFLLAGQSNIAGRGRITDEIIEDDSNLHCFIDYSEHERDNELFVNRNSLSTYVDDSKGIQPNFARNIHYYDPKQGWCEL